MDLEHKLSEYAHNTWSGWMKYLFSKCVMNEDGTATLPESLVLRWNRQLNTKYDDLPENEKLSDQVEARMILNIIEGKD